MRSVALLVLAGALTAAACSTEITAPPPALPDGLRLDVETVTRTCPVGFHLVMEGGFPYSSTTDRNGDKGMCYVLSFNGGGVKITTIDNNVPVDAIGRCPEGFNAAAASFFTPEDLNQNSVVCTALAPDGTTTIVIDDNF